MSHRLVIYTCITGNYDWLFPPLFRSPGVGFICFTDDPHLRARGWEVRPLPATSRAHGGAAANRHCKMFPWPILPAHDWSLYVDANARVLRDPRPLVDEIEARGFELAIPRHADREDLWQEAQACIREAKVSADDGVRLMAQVRRYHEEGLPSRFGVTENNIVFRCGRCTNLHEPMARWWSEFVGGVPRDQISLPYVLWKTGTPVCRLPMSARTANPYFRKVPHRVDGDLHRYLTARGYHGLGWQLLLRFSRAAKSLERRLGA